MTRMRLSGSKEVRAALRRAAADVRDEAGRAVAETAISVESRVSLMIQRGPATGRVYQKYNPKRSHRASAPGQAPATDIGRLAGSIESEQRGQLTWTVGSPLAYARYLEFGTSKIRPRPAWVPAIVKEGPLFEERLNAAVAGAMP